MQGDYIKSEAFFSFELSGEECIDAAHLATILDNTVEMCRSISSAVPDAFVKLNITKFSTGSFDIDFQAVAEQLNNFIQDPKTVAGAVAGAMLGAFKIAKHLKGEKPKSVLHAESKTKITNADGVVISVPQLIGKEYFKEAQIENSVINIVQQVEELRRPGFTVAMGEERAFFDIDDLKKCAPVVEKMDAQDDTFTDVSVRVLIVRKPDLQGSTPWGFIADRNITATIEDEAFLDRVHSGEYTFSKGTKLRVRLRHTVSLDENGEIAGQPTYVVEEVLSAPIKGELDQMSINLD